MNLGQWPDKRALLHPRRPFLSAQGKDYDNQSFAALIGHAAQGLLSAGLTRGDRVALLMGNSPAFLQLFFACARIGAVLVPLNHGLAVPELAQVIRHCRPRLVVHSPAFAAVLDEIERHAPLPCPRLEHGDHAIPDAFAASPGEAPQPPWPVEENDPLLLIYTSGSSGRQKGAVLTHRNLLFGAVHNLLSYPFSPVTRSLVVAPLFHIGALGASALPVLYAGGSLVLRSFDNPSEILHLIAREGITFLFAVPAMFKMLTKAPAWAEADFSRVAFFMSGGAPLPEELIRTYQEEKGVVFAQGYGMTETQRLTALDLHDARRKAGSIGKEVFHTALRLVDERGEEVAPGAVGEVVVQGPTVFSGYWDDPVATAEALRDGWFHTGDLGRRDEEGFLYIVGRTSDLIITSGENISAREVEQALEAIPEIAEAAVVGIPDAVRGEAVVALVTLRPETMLTAEDVLARLKPRLAPYKLPRRVRFASMLPRTGSGKVAKEDIKKIFAGHALAAEENGDHGS